MNYAKSNPDLVILAVNTFVRVIIVTGCSVLSFPVSRRVIISSQLLTTIVWSDNIFLLENRIPTMLIL